MKRIRALVLVGFALLVLILIVVAVQCKPGNALPPTASPSPQAGPPASVATAAVVVRPPVASQSSPPVQPFTDNWDDRSVYRAGLIQGEQDTLSALLGASVYHLDVRIADDLLSLQGSQRVRYTNQDAKALDAVYFQLFPNMWGGKSTVSAVKVDGQEVLAATESGASAVRVPLSRALQPGERVVIQMDYLVEVPTEIGGGYGLFGFFNDILVLDGFYPAIPVFDEKGWHDGPVPANADSTFQDAAFYLVNVSAPGRLALVASGIAVASDSKDGRQTVTFAAGPARDFYIAASERFTVLSGMAGETKVNSYAFKEWDAGSRAALTSAAAAIRAYGARFGTFPYSEFDVVSTPMQGAIGIEYPGITGINYTVYDPAAKVSGVAASQLLEGTVAHEVGHQWFYNVVGNDQANEPWLDEAVTQYVTGLYYLDSYGPQGMDGDRANWVSRWDRVGRRAIPIGLPAGDYQGREYGAIVYGRGPLFLEAMAKKLGQATFDRFLRDYCQANEWGIATTASFKKLAESECQCDLTAMFDEWVYSK